MTRSKIVQFTVFFYALERWYGLDVWSLKKSLETKPRGPRLSESVGLTVLN